MHFAKVLIDLSSEVFDGQTANSSQPQPLDSEGNTVKCIYCTHSQEKKPLDLYITLVRKRIAAILEKNSAQYHDTT